MCFFVVWLHFLVIVGRFSRILGGGQRFVSVISGDFMRKMRNFVENPKKITRIFENFFCSSGSRCMQAGRPERAGPPGGRAPLSPRVDEFCLLKSPKMTLTKRCPPPKMHENRPKITKNCSHTTKKHTIHPNFYPQTHPEHFYGDPASRQISHERPAPKIDDFPRNPTKNHEKSIFFTK